MRIRRRCKCGCRGITNYGKKYIHGHHRKNKKHLRESKTKMSLSHKNKKFSKKHRNNISLSLVGNVHNLGRKFSEEHKKNMSLSLIGNTNSIGNTSRLGKKHSFKSKLKMSLAKLKCDPNYQYCDIWKDIEYKNDLRKDYCENLDCKSNSALVNHHIYLDKKRCAPNEVITLCRSCHPILHRRLQRKQHIVANYLDYLIINRPDHISYIHKKSKEIIKIKIRGCCAR